MIIGITGGLATGKSSAGRYLSSYLNGHLIDADSLAHLTLARRGPAYKRVISCFGKDILSKKGLIDRARLADKAFSKRSNLKKLSEIIHPLVIRDINARIKKMDNRKREKTFIIIDGPLLIEAGLHKNCDCLVVVISSLSEQLERARRYKKINPADALSRMRLQMPLCKKVNFADYIIDNSGSLQELKKKSKQLAEKIRSS